MDDQFAEWDKFYEAYQRTMTTRGAIQRYKRRRKKEQYEKAAKKARETRARNATKASSG